MLSQEEEVAFSQSVKRVSDQASRHLSILKTAHQLIQFIGKVQQNIDRVAERYVKNPLRIAIGCDHCCLNRVVEVSEPEVFYITAFLKQLSQAALENITKRLQENVDHRASVGQANLACTFLQNHQCTIYAVRPAVCRKAHSLSVLACEKNEKNIPQKLSVILDAEAIMTGVNQAYLRSGLTVRTSEINQAILTALRNDHAEHEWMHARIAKGCTQSSTARGR